MPESEMSIKQRLERRVQPWMSRGRRTQTLLFLVPFNVAMYLLGTSDIKILGVPLSSSWLGMTTALLIYLIGDWVMDEIIEVRDGIPHLKFSKIGIVGRYGDTTIYIWYAYGILFAGVITAFVTLVLLVGLFLASIGAFRPLLVVAYDLYASLAVLVSFERKYGKALSSRRPPSDQPLKRIRQEPCSE